MFLNKGNKTFTKHHLISYEEWQPSLQKKDSRSHLSTDDPESGEWGKEKEKRKTTKKSISIGCQLKIRNPFERASLPRRKSRKAES